MKHLIKLVLLFMISGSSLLAQSPIEIKPGTTRHGPEKGSLLIIGGNVGETPAIWNKFVELAGGKENAKVLVVTAASGDSAAHDQRDVDEIKRITGIQHIQLLHPASVAEANTEKFVAPIREATGIYFIGGRQWRIADLYLNTLAHQAFFDLLDRGGVIAGSSAGASIQGSLLWRGDTKGNEILLGDHTQGLGFLKNSAIDQHVLVRNRQFDLVNVIKFNPELIGLGPNEATAMLIQRDTLEVIGNSFVAIYDYKTIQGNNGPFFFLAAGQKYDLKNRKVIQPVRNQGRRNPQKDPGTTSSKNTAVNKNEEEN